MNSSSLLPRQLALEWGDLRRQIRYANGRCSGQAIGEKWQQMKSGSIIVCPDTAESYSVDLEEGQTLSIGRKPTSKGALVLVLPFPEVSSQHAEIRCHPNAWTIIDSGSTNGTTINGMRLTPGREYTLKDKDVVGIAQYNLLVASPSSSPEGWGAETDEDQEITQFRIHLINATILVGDIKRFSSLMEDYAFNPDLVMQGASRVFDRLNVEIDKNYGHLEKIAGDAIMAYWHGDNSRAGTSMQAYQACLTALQLKEITAKLAKDENYWPFPNHPLMMDLALATGPVATGALGHFQGNPALLGDTANMVFRLEKLIGDDNPGDIFVEASTYDLAKEHFDFDFLGEFSVRGRQRTMTVYRLTGLKKQLKS
jgi:adenylate cyclase